jgi:hypothetical protein
VSHTAKARSAATIARADGSPSSSSRCDER